MSKKDASRLEIVPDYSKSAADLWTDLVLKEAHNEILLKDTNSGIWFTWRSTARQLQVMLGLDDNDPAVERVIRHVRAERHEIEAEIDRRAAEEDSKEAECDSREVEKDRREAEKDNKHAAEGQNRGSWRERVQMIWREIVQRSWRETKRSQRETQRSQRETQRESRKQGRERREAWRAERKASREKGMTETAQPHNTLDPTNTPETSTQGPTPPTTIAEKET